MRPGSTRSGEKATYQFTVTFSDNLAIDVSSLDNDDVRVTGPGAFDVPATFDILGVALTTARAVTTGDASSPLMGPGFEPLAGDRLGFAVPVIAGGRVVAIVYAEGGSSEGQEPPLPSGWPEVVEVLAPAHDVP